MDYRLKNLYNFINPYQILSFDNTPHLEKNGVFFIFENEKEKNENLKSFLFFNNLFFNQKFNINYKLDVNLILNILNNKSYISFLTLNELFKKIPSKKEFLKNVLIIEKDKKIKISEIISKLLTIGYEYNHNINIDNNNFKNYGDIIEIKINNKLYKIELLGNKIEKINIVDDVTKRRSDEIEKIEIFPTDNILNYKEVFINDYIDKDYHFIYNENIKDEINNIFNIDKYNNIVFSKMFSKKYELNILENYNNNFQKIKNDFANFNKGKYKINLLSFSKNNLINVFNENDINLEGLNIFEIKNEINFDGFIDEKNKIIFLNDNNLFLKSADHKIKIEDKSIEKLNKNQRINKKRKYFISEIKEGDFVVHIDHGIGIFSGIIKNKLSDEIEREYIVLKYEDDDLLYVPIESIDRVDKYVGKDSPRLHRLSESISWVNKRQKIKEDIFKYANELLDIFAKRRISKIEPMVDDIELEQKLADTFEYVETDDQLKAINEVYKDLKSGQPMDRLICGDVGFGKTEIAIRAAFKAVINGYQAMILCPTTILSQQHFDTFSTRLKDFGIKITLLNRFTKIENKKNNVIENIKDGKFDIIIGTHRLLSKDISFNNLGLVIVDEEQKFGSLSKERLKKFRNNIHVLTMSATPIPRTLNMSLTNIMNMSIISTPPKNRLDINTIIDKYNEDTVKKAIQDEIDRGGQVYYLYNKVETIDICTHNLKKLLPKVKFGIAHGQMHAHELLTIFHKFDIGEIDVLVCTTLIENGIDLPNVNTLIVENAERFGLSQLHQLRGRVGRSNRQAFAYFLYKNENMNQDAEKRLNALEEANKIGDGFKIASRDMEIRGIGNILGQQQHGYAYSIGLNLYSRLLDQAINKINYNIDDDINFETKINLPINFNIPEDIIKNQNERISIYQKFSMIDDEEELKEEFIKKFNNFNNKNIYNLYNILKLKISAKQLKIKNIEYNKSNMFKENKEKIILDFEDKIDEKLKYNLLEKIPNLIIKEKQIKIDGNDLGVKWLEELIKLISQNE